jgi:hypothetical protein
VFEPLLPSPPSAPVAILSSKEAASLQYDMHNEFDFLEKSPFWEASHMERDKSLTTEDNFNP